jgi:hypothetical protein
MFPRAVGQIGHGIPIHGADEAEVAGGDHGEGGGTPRQRWEGKR